MNTVIWSAEVLGEPASKANSRRLVSVRGKPRFIKSQKALDYSKNFLSQVQPVALKPPVSFDVEIYVKIYYATRRPDLDESVILDLLQGIVYENDRQVKKKTIEWGLDRVNPRCIIEIKALESGSGSGCSRFGQP